MAWLSDSDGKFGDEDMAENRHAGCHTSSSLKVAGVRCSEADKVCPEMDILLINYKISPFTGALIMSCQRKISWLSGLHPILLIRFYRRCSFFCWLLLSPRLLHCSSTRYIYTGCFLYVALSPLRPITSSNLLTYFVVFSQICTRRPFWQMLQWCS